MGWVLLGYLGLSAILVASMVGPMVAGRVLADREPPLDPEVLAIEAEALALLAGSGVQDLPKLPPAR